MGMGLDSIFGLEFCKEAGQERSRSASGMTNKRTSNCNGIGNRIREWLFPDRRIAIRRARYRPGSGWEFGPALSSDKRISLLSCRLSRPRRGFPRNNCAGCCVPSLDRSGSNRVVGAILRGSLPPSCKRSPGRSERSRFRLAGCR